MPGADFVHPETGEILCTEEEWTAAIDALEENLSATYRVLWPLREARAERFPPPDLPAPRYRTEKQEKVARCPRCGGRLESEEPPE